MTPDVHVHVAMIIISKLSLTITSVFERSYVINMKLSRSTVCSFVYLKLAITMHKSRNVISLFLDQYNCCCLVGWYTYKVFLIFNQI